MEQPIFAGIAGPLLIPEHLSFLLVLWFWLHATLSVFFSLFPTPPPIHRCASMAKGGGYTTTDTSRPAIAVGDRRAVCPWERLLLTSRSCWLHQSWLRS